MRKKLLLLFAICSLSLCFGAAGCKPSGGEGESSSLSASESVEITDEVENELIKLLNLRVEEGSLRWNSVVNANAYTLYVNGVKVKEFGDDDTFSYEYDKTEKDYTAKMVVSGEKLTNFETSIDYRVENLKVEQPEVFANSVKFAPQTTKIYFRVLPNTDWNEVNESNIVNFESYEKGKTVEYEFYVEGTGYDAEKGIYYADSVVTKNSLKIKDQLQNVTLSIGEDGISWAAVTGAKNYTVVADGEEKTVTTTSFALDATLGAHTVYVYANPQDEGTYFPSEKACVEYETVKQSVETFTIGESKVVFDGKTLDVLYYKSNGGWTKATETALVKSDLSVKFASYYDQAENIYYLESKPLTFKTGEKLAVTFDKEGYINMANDGKDVQFKLFDVEEAEPADYNVTGISNYYIGNCEEGKNYRFKSKFLDEIQRGETEDIYCEYSEDELDFYTLPTPNVKILNEKVVWTIDARAESYIYGTAEGELDGVATESFAVDPTVVEYFMQAIGSNDNYVLSSPIAKLDATKWGLTAEQLEGGFRFDSERDVQGATLGSASISATYDETKNAMKITSTEKNKEFVISVEPFEVNAGDFLTVEYYNTVKNAGVSVNGVWGATTWNENATDFESVVVYSAKQTETISKISLKIFGITEGDGVYVRSVKLVRKTNITETELLEGYRFESEEDILGKVSFGTGSTASYDTAEQAMKVVQNGSGAERELKFNSSLTLNAGDKVVLTMKISNQYNGGSFRVNGASKGEIKNADDYVQYTWTADGTYTDAYVGFIAYENGVAYYVRSIQIIKKTEISKEQLLAGYQFNSSAAVLPKVSTVGSAVSYDGTENAMKVVQAGSGTDRELRFNASVDLKAGDKIVLTIKISNQWGGGSFRINGTAKGEIKNTTDYVQYTWTADADYTDAYVGFIAYENDVAYYVQSIKLVRASA